MFIDLFLATKGVLDTFFSGVVREEIHFYGVFLFDMSIRFI